MSNPAPHVDPSPWPNQDPSPLTDERLVALVSAVELRLEEMQKIELERKVNDKRIVELLATVQNTHRELLLVVNAQEERFRTLANQVLATNKRVENMERIFSDINSRLATVERADRHREYNWNAERTEVLEAVKSSVAKIVGDIADAKLAAAEKQISDAAATLKRLEVSGHDGSIDRLVALLDPDKIAMLREAIDLIVASRVAEKQKQQSIHDAEQEAKLATQQSVTTEQRLRPWSLRLSLLQVLVVIILSVGAALGFTTCGKSVPQVNAGGK